MGYVIYPGKNGFLRIFIKSFGKGLNMQTELLQVTGMTCGGCTSNVANALKKIDGVVDAHVSLAAGEATVKFDERMTSPEHLRLAVQRAGYGIGTATPPIYNQKKHGCCG